MPNQDSSDLFIQIDNIYIACSAIDHAEFIPEAEIPGYGPEPGEEWDPEFHTGPSVSPARVVIHTVRGMSFHESDPQRVAPLMESLKSRSIR